MGDLDKASLFISEAKQTIRPGDVWLEDKQWWHKVVALAFDRVSGKIGVMSEIKGSEARVNVFTLAETWLGETVVRKGEEAPLFQRVDQGYGS